MALFFLNFPECLAVVVRFLDFIASLANDGFNAIFVEYKTGAITGEDNESGLMRSPSRKRGNVTAIK